MADHKITEYEKGLVEKLKMLQTQKTLAKAAYEEASSKFEELQAEVISFLEDDGNRKKTSVYNGLGWITLVDGALSASIEEGFQDDVMDYVRTIGREDLIKTSINSKTLSSFIDQMLKANEPLPPHVTFFRPKKARFYPEKG